MFYANISKIDGLKECDDSFLGQGKTETITDIIVTCWKCYKFYIVDENQYETSVLSLL